MKRVVLAVTGTVAGVAALLSFKTQSPAVANGGSLPAASLSAPSSAAPASSSAASSSAASSSAASAVTTPARTYLGSSITTRYGVVQVKVTVQGKKITSVSFAQLTAFDDRSQQINADAAPRLLQATLSAQSATVDTVSGASYTSDGYRQSLQSALDQAGI
jgi:uncharacterized protein with FMN-binding domain